MEHLLLNISCISRMSLVCLFRGPVNACLYLEPGYLIYIASYEMSSYSTHNQGYIFATLYEQDLATLSSLCQEKSIGTATSSPCQ